MCWLTLFHKSNICRHFKWSVILLNPTDFLNQCKFFWNIFLIQSKSELDLYSFIYCSLLYQSHMNLQAIKQPGILHGNEDSWKYKSKIEEQNIFRGKRIDKHTFFLWKLRWWICECKLETCRKLIFTMNFSVLDFFKFPSRKPQTTQILVSTFKIFPEEHTPGPPKIVPLFCL